MKAWKPVDLIVTVIACSLCAGMVLVIVARLFIGGATDEATAGRIAAFIGAMTSIVSMYVGSRVGKNDDEGGE